MRDNALATALRARGHDAMLAPLYLPLFLEEEIPAEPVHMGGINMYLQQKLPLARHTPRPVADLLDRPGLLRWASSLGNMTDASKLGAMTLSMLRGEEGRQAQELDKLCDWVSSLDAPDVIVLANAMLLGTVRKLKERVGAPIACTLQGEAPFLDALSEPYCSEAWATAGERAREVDALVPVSEDYGALMSKRLQLSPERVHTVPNGIDLADYREAPLAEPAHPTVGYLARMCADKGLPTLVEAFCSVGREIPDARLRVCGVVLREDEALVRRMKARLAEAGLADRSEFLPNVDRAAKLAYLRTLSVLSVPALYGESFGLYLLEAMASGVPVIQPRTAAFPEVLAATGGGELCEPDDPKALAAALVDLLRDEPRRRSLAERGRAAVFDRFGAEHMAAGVEEVCRMIAISPEGT